MFENKIGAETTGTLRAEHPTTYEGMQGSTQVTCVPFVIIDIFILFLLDWLYRKGKSISAV